MANDVDPSIPVLTDIPNIHLSRTSDGELWFPTTVRLRDDQGNFTLTDNLAPDETTQGGITNDLSKSVDELGRRD